MMIHYMTRDAKTRSVVAMALAVMLLAGCQEDMIKAPASGRLDMLPLEDYPQIAVQPGLQEALVFAPAVVEPSSSSLACWDNCKSRDDAGLTAAGP